MKEKLEVRKMATEKRLIDANALLEDFGEEPMVWNDGEAEIQERSDWHRYRVIVKLQPTVDAVEVVHGEWEKQQGIYSCSICGKVCPYDVQADIIQYWTCNYCPNCGAKMDGERRTDNG